MKILHVIFSFQVGGSETMLVDILNNQIQDNNTIELLIINNDYNNELIEQIDKRIKIKHINRKQASRNILPLVYINLHILKLNPDVIHFHDNNGIKAIILNKWKTILTIHDVGLDTQYLDRYDHLCAISQAVQQDIRSRTNKSTILVYNGINLEKIETKIKHTEDNKSFRIVQISRLEHDKKGQDILIKALKEVKNQLPQYNINLDLIGDGKSSKYLKDLVAELDLNQQVHFLGLKDRRYIYKNLCDYDLLVQPSRYEGFGLTVIEGMAAKIPVLVSNNDGPMEIIRNGKYGYYFKKNDISNCAEALVKIITNITGAKILTEDAYQYVSENYGIKRTAQQYLDIYSK